MSDKKRQPVDKLLADELRESVAALESWHKDERAGPLFMKGLCGFEIQKTCIMLDNVQMTAKQMLSTASRLETILSLCGEAWIKDLIKHTIKHLKSDAATLEAGEVRQTAEIIRGLTC